MKKVLAYIISGITFLGGAILMNMSRGAHELLFFIAMFLLLASTVFLFIGAMSGKKNTIRRLSLIAVMGALSAILYILLKFPLPIFPNFLDIQISEIPALLIGLAYGPEEAIAILLVRFVIKLFFSSSIMVGEFADLIISLTLVLVASIIYKKHRNIKGAILGCLIGVILSTIVAMIANAFVLVPAYIELYFAHDEAMFIEACKVIPNINENNYMSLYIFAAVLPFNLLRYVIVMAIAFPIYKSTHKLFDKIIG